MHTESLADDSKHRVMCSFVTVNRTEFETAVFLLSPNVTVAAAFRQK